MEFLDVAQKLPHLIGLRLSADILQIQRTIRRGMFEDVMAAADTIQTVPEGLRETAQFFKANVVRPCQHFCQQFAVAAHTFTSTVMLVSQPKTSTTFTQAMYLPGLGYLSKPASLTVLRERSLRVR